jgi:hypothetical protein
MPGLDVDPWCATPPASTSLQRPVSEAEDHLVAYLAGLVERRVLSGAPGQSRDHLAGLYQTGGVPYELKGLPRRVRLVEVRYAPSSIR